MKKLVTRIALITTLISMASGCASTSSRQSSWSQPQRNVATGTLVGAGLGAIIGNQVGSGHPATGAVIGGLLGGASGAIVSRPR